MKRERGAFRNLARGAKERLGGNFWPEVHGARRAEIERARFGGVASGDALNKLYTSVKSRVVHVRESDPAEELFYARVREILCKDIENPLSHVLDRGFMRELGDAERERYVFTLSERVKSCVERFEQERIFEKAVGV